MTCGWGSFLISAEDRLAELPDMNGRRLSTYIFGNDDDSTTAELARVALLTSTGKDSWEISHQDARRLQLPRGKVPNIIVGNPPFSGDRKTHSLRIPVANAMNLPMNSWVTRWSCGARRIFGNGHARFVCGERGWTANAQKTFGFV